MCCYDELARCVRHRHVDLKLVDAFGGHLHGTLADDAAQHVYILAARGVGYRLANQRTAEAERPAVGRHTSTRLAWLEWSGASHRTAPANVRRAVEGDVA